jgi:hypothetical protein
MSINREKIALLIPRLASNFGGEVIATVAAIRRLLSASGNDLHDLARLVVARRRTKKSRSKRNHEKKIRGSKKRKRGRSM